MTNVCALVQQFLRPLGFNFISYNWCWAVYTHAAGIWTFITIIGSFMVLASNKQTNPLPSIITNILAFLEEIPPKAPCHLAQ